MTHPVTHRPLPSTSYGIIPMGSQTTTAELPPVATTNGTINQALTQATSLSPSLPPSLFPGGSASTAAATTPTGSNKPSEPSPWTQGGPTGCGCGAKGCGGSQGNQSQGTQSQDITKRSENPVSKEDSPGSGALPPAPPPSIFNN